VLADVSFTKASRIDNRDKAAVRNMYEKTTGAIMVFSLPALLFILCFPELVLHVLAGKEFVKAAPILRITAFFGFVLPFLKQYGTIMDATGFPHINFRTNLLAFVLNIAFNYIVWLYGRCHWYGGYIYVHFFNNATHPAQKVRCACMAGVY
jgi:O-antigen/teichoic acid export membrane protein